MAYNLPSCVTSQENTGSKQCYEDFGWWRKLILTPNDGEIDTQTNAELLATWTTAINAATGDRWYPLKNFFDKEDEDEETQYKEGGAGQMLETREGKRSFTGMVKIALCEHQAYRTHNNRSNIKCYIVTSKGFILGTSSDGTKFEPFSINLFKAEKLTSAANGSEVSMTPLKVILDDTTEWDDNGVYIKASDCDFNPLTDLDGLQDVTLAVTSPTVAGFTLTVTTTCDQVPVTGLVKDDFVLVDDAGGAETITTLTDNSDGTYTAAATLGADDYILTMDDPEDATTKGYEATSTATFTVSS